MNLCVAFERLTCFKSFFIQIKLKITLCIIIYLNFVFDLKKNEGPALQLENKNNFLCCSYILKLNLPIIRPICQF